MSLGSMRCCLVALLLTIPSYDFATAQTIYENLTGGDPATFDTADPAAYGRDFPFLPETDPMSMMPRDEPMSMPNLLSPDAKIEWPVEQMMAPPAASPGDYNPEGLSIQSRLPDEMPLQAGFETPSSEQRGVLLTDRGHAAFYVISFITDMEAVPINTTLPYIPAALFQFDKNQATRLNFGRFRTAFDLTTTTAYNNNVFGTQTNLKGDVIYSFQPKFYLETGTKGFLGLTYAPTFSYYATYKDQNSANQNFSLAFRYPFSKLAIGADLFYLTQSGLFVTSEGPAKSDTYQANLFASYPITKKTQISSSLQSTLYINDPGGVKKETYISGAIDHQISPPITAGGSLTGGLVDSEIDNETYVVVRARGSFIPSYHYQVMGDFGVQARNLSVPAGGQSQIMTPVFDLSARYNPIGSAAFILRAYRKLDSNTFGSVNLNIQTAAEASVLVRFFRKYELKLKLESGYVEQLSNGEPTRSDFRFVQGGVSFSYAIMNLIDLTVFSNMQQRFESSNGSDYTSNVTGFGIVLKF